MLPLELPMQLKAHEAFAALGAPEEPAEQKHLRSHHLLLVKQKKLELRSHCWSFSHRLQVSAEPC